jgi:RNA polymerase sigma factor (sigma-70 family)
LRKHNCLKLQSLEKLNTNTELPDTALVAAFKQEGDQQWLAVLYQRYAGLLFGVCLKYLKEVEAAQDACTDIYEELVIKLRKHEVDNFKGWLHVLAKNHCLQKLRAGKKLPTTELPEQFMQLEDNWHLEEVMAKEASLTAMQNCIDQLTPDQKAMVELFYLQEKCYNEITDITGLSWNTVRSHIQNGRRNLKNCMDQNGR